MDERIPPLATYPAPKQRPPKAGMSMAAQRTMFLLLGLAIGGVLVIGTIKLTERNEPKVVYKAVPPATGAEQKSAPPPAVPNGPPLGANVPAANPGEIKVDPNTLPYNPFAPKPNGAVGAMPSKEISGHIDEGSGMKLPPNGPRIGETGGPGARLPGAPPLRNPKTPSPGDPSAQVSEVVRGLLVKMSMDVRDPASAVGALGSAVGKLGGSAIQFDESATKPDAEGALVFVPAGKAEEAEKLLASVGSVVVRDSWSGGADARIDRIEQAAQDRLSDMRIKRQELLVKFFEDAPQVKHLDEDMERIQKSIASFRARKPGQSVAIFKIKFLG